jgi:peptidoglycan/LPS O-acetylase OafA/YrhL
MSRDPVTWRSARGVAVARAFSLRHNIRALMLRPVDHFSPLDGVRGLFTPWVIAAHCLFSLGPVAFRAAIEARPGLRFAFVAHYAIDAFFVMSGFLIAHLLMREHRHTGTLAIGRFLARRAARLLPAYYLAIGVYATLGGPHREHLVYNLLYVNNSLPILNQFMPWTWSLAVEEQFYLALPLILSVILRLRYFRGALLIGLFVLAAFVRLILVDVHDFGAPLVDPYGRALTIVDSLYTKTYSRFGALCCGVYIAYLKHYDPRPIEWLERSPRAALLLFALALGVIALLFTPTAPLDIQQFQFGNSWPVWLLPAAVALNRYAFAVAFSCLTVLMLSSSLMGRWFGRALGLPVWFPLAQLSYAAYLFHPMIIEALPRPASASYGDMALFFVQTCALTYLVALGVYLAVERPFLNLRALLSGKERAVQGVAPASATRS